MVKGLLALLLLLLTMHASASYVLIPGEGEQTLVLDFASDSQFTYTSADIEFSNGVARLKNQYGSTVLFAATYGSSVNADYSAGGASTTGTVIGTVTQGSGKLDLSGNDAAYKQISYASNLNMFPNGSGTLRWRYTPDYTGAPAARQYILTSSLRTGSDTHSIAVWHNDTTGALWIQVLDQANQVIAQTSGTYSAVSGTEVEMEVNIHLPGSNGYVTVYVNDTRVINVTSITKVLTDLYGYIKFGGYIQDTDASAFANNKIDDFAIYNVATNSGANRTTGYTLPTTPYLTTDPTVEQTDAVTVSSFSGFTLGELASGSDAVKCQIRVDGTLKYWNGSAWTTSNGSFSQANTEEDINNQIINLSGGAAKVRCHLHSNNGATTPTISNASLVYQ